MMTEAWIFYLFSGDTFPKKKSGQNLGQFFFSPSSINSYLKISKKLFMFLALVFVCISSTYTQKF